MVVHNKHDNNHKHRTTAFAAASTVVPHSRRVGVHGEIRRSWNPDAVPCLGYDGGCQTLYESFRHGAALNPLGPCLGFRAVSTSGLATPFIYSSYSECLARVNALAAGFEELQLLGHPNQNGGDGGPTTTPTSRSGSDPRLWASYNCLGLCMKNCMEWILAEQGAYAMGGVIVPLYNTLDATTMAYILHQTQTKTVVCTRDELSTLCQAKQTTKTTNASSSSIPSSSSLDCFTTVVLVDGVTKEAALLAEQASLVILSLAHVEAVGARRITEQGGHHDHSPPSPLDVATFCYTSGTTGMPKGAMLTHQNFISAMAGLVTATGFVVQCSDRHLSYLPLAHIMERVVLNKILAGGASVGFYRGDPLYLVEDLQACRPTVLPVAPRVLNKIYDKIQAGISAAGGLKKKLFDTAVATKTKNLLEHGQLTHTLYDRLIFHKLRHGLGMDHLRLMISGSAPLAYHIMIFFRILLGIPVVEGYGQTEGTAAGTLAHPRHVATAGHVGGPVGCVEITLFDVPDMGYFHTDRQHADGTPCHGRGEIAIRGPSVFLGYYKDDVNTHETLDDASAGRWLHSGDIGLWRPDGSLQIIDRKKNLFKLAQGEYVAPEKIENILTQSPLIAQCFVHGDSFQTCLVAIVVPDEEVVTARFLSSSSSNQPSNDNKKNTTHKNNTFANLCRTSPSFQQELLHDIQRLSKENGLHGFEIVKAIHVESEPFSVENDLLTPTFKLKRQQCRQRYQTELDRLYQTLDTTTAAGSRPPPPPPQSKL